MITTNECQLDSEQTPPLWMRFPGIKVESS